MSCIGSGNMLGISAKVPRVVTSSWHALPVGAPQYISAHSHAPAWTSGHNVPGNASVAEGADT